MNLCFEGQAHGREISMASAQLYDQDRGAALQGMGLFALGFGS